MIIVTAVMMVKTVTQRYPLLSREFIEQQVIHIITARRNKKQGTRLKKFHKIRHVYITLVGPTGR